MQAIRPKVLTPPLQLGLAVQMHHQFGSRVLIDKLHKHGYCSSYASTQRFEHSAAVDKGADIPHFDRDKQFVQFSADNVDHNLRTLDGKGTFHGMGMIAVVTPSVHRAKLIPKCTAVTPQDLKDIAKVNIHFCPRYNQLIDTRYEPLPTCDAIDSTSEINLLWKASMLLKPPWCAWSGLMQGVHCGDHPGISDIMFLPLINMDPTDMSCIY